ncbi:MAG: alpha/beta fold hydrolase [Proteobacteria bacterium]|nr:alpha/beta fold hydrolase [Pseudomonadota bacterium]TDJ36024.1 MAG: S9 family peptidase [Gammaproteobacteria bacterium]
MQLFRKSIFGVAILTAVSVLAADSIQRTEANNGKLIMEDIPVIPDAIVNDLNQFQNVRSASFRDWTENGRGVYITTRFGDVNQIHRVDMPGGARQQITFYKEPVGGVSRQPGGRKLIFTRDTGGSEFTQIFMLDPADGSTKLLTDGKSRNGATVWDRQGRRFAYQSTRRNGAANDVWLMDPMDPAASEMILESPDGTWWGPAEFSESGSKLLISNYVSIADSRVYILDLDSREKKLMAGGAQKTSANIPLGFDKDEGGFWLVTDSGGEFKQLAWQRLQADAEPEIVTADIPWDVNNGEISHDRRRIAFAANENGRSKLYLLDTETKQYRSVDNIPTGLLFGLDFSPDDRYLGMTLNTATTPSDTFVLELGDGPLEHGRLIRWTTSEVGGLDTSIFQTPELIEYPTFDNDGDSQRQIPAWLYKPRGAGPFPVVISIHGGPEGQARPGFSSTYQMWVEKLGIAVVIPNVRGSSGYGKSYLSLDNGFRREDSVRDIGALLDWIATQPDLDQDRVAVFGGSYGGYMVLASAFHYSDKLKAAVDIVGISNFVTFLENTQDYRRDLRRAEYGDERDPAMRAHLEKISPLNNVEKIAIPMLIVQGENDPRVPVTESKQVVEALRSQGQTVWFMNALNEGHGYRKKENRDIYQQVTVLFLQEHLIGGD